MDKLKETASMLHEAQKKIVAMIDYPKLFEKGTPGYDLYQELKLGAYFPPYLSNADYLTILKIKEGLLNTGWYLYTKQINDRYFRQVKRQEDGDGQKSRAT